MTWAEGNEKQSDRVLGSGSAPGFDWFAPILLPRFATQRTTYKDMDTQAANSNKNSWYMRAPVHMYTHTCTRASSYPTGTIAVCVPFSFSPSLLLSSSSGTSDHASSHKRKRCKQNTEQKLCCWICHFISEKNYGVVCGWVCFLFMATVLLYNWTRSTCVEYMCMVVPQTAPPPSTRQHIRHSSTLSAHRERTFSPGTGSFRSQRIFSASSTQVCEPWPLPTSCPI